MQAVRIFYVIIRRQYYKRPIKFQFSEKLVKLIVIAFCPFIHIQINFTGRSCMLSLFSCISNEQLPICASCQTRWQND